MEVAGSILDEVSFFLSEDRITLQGGVAGSIPYTSSEKKYFLGTVQPVHLEYVHVLFPTFSLQQICLGYVHYLLNSFPAQ